MSNASADPIKMELPDLGLHCSLESCQKLDFLPFTCSNCHQIFCKQHYITSAHDCKHLNEFFKKREQAETPELFDCSNTECKNRSPLQLLCSYCNLHFCIAHRHHGCRDDLPKGERKKLQVEQWKKPREQFRLAKAQVDTKVEMQLRKAEQKTQLQPLAQKIRLMKLKGTALGEGKIPSDDRIYFAVHPPQQSSNLKPSPLYTSKQWSVGRTIDLFSKKMKVENKNNEKDALKLRLFKLSDGEMVAKTTCVSMGSLVNSVLVNGDSLILDYVHEEELGTEIKIDGEILEKFRQSVMG